MTLGKGEVRVYASPENKLQVIAAKKAQGYVLIEWISGGYSGVDVAYFRREGSVPAGQRAEGGGE